MVIITITKQTKAGAPMFDTINLDELQDYEAKGWRKDDPKTMTSVEIFRKEVKGKLAKIPKIDDIWNYKSTLMAAADIGMKNHKPKKEKTFRNKCSRELQKDLGKKRYTKRSWDTLVTVCSRTLRHGEPGFDLLKKVDGLL